MSNSTLHAIINKDEQAILENSAKKLGPDSVASYAVNKSKILLLVHNLVYSNISL